MQVSQAGTPGPATTAPTGYYDTVAAFLYQRWAQPSRAELGGRKPTVAITLAIDANGKVRNAAVVRPSGLAPMDGSVTKLLAGLTELPPPPGGAMTLSVSLEIVEE
jgi:TonB family protein